MEAYLVVKAPGAWLVVPVVPDLNACQWEDLVVIGPSRTRDVDELQRIVQSQKLSANLQDGCNFHSCDTQGRI